MAFPAKAPESQLYEIRRSISIVGELHVNAKVPPTQQRNYLLQRVAVFPADAHRITLNRGLDLLLGILNHFYNLTRLLNGDSLLHGDLLTDGGTRRLLDHPVIECLDGHVALDQLALQNIVHRFEL